jgi:dethiobiotin synthetase
VKGYFVTGTGTGVGKTYVAAALARLALQAGKKVFAFKPIETGCVRVDGRLVGSDQDILCEAAGGWQVGELRGTYCFEPAVAPAVASDAIKLDRIESVLDRGAALADIVLVEGAGGWRVPITETEDTADLARRCRLPVIVVAHAGLGTINHSLLTIEAVEKTQQVAWLVLSQRPDDDPKLVESNIQQISKRWTTRVIAYGGSENVARGTLLSRLIY